LQILLEEVFTLELLNTNNKLAHRSGRQSFQSRAGNAQVYGLRKVVQSRSLSAARRHAMPAPGDKMKILIVDDDDVLRTRLAKHLRTLWG